MLNWKHYAGAGAVALLLIAVPIALIGGKEPDPVAQPQAPTTVQPSATPTPQSSQPTAREVPYTQPGPGSQDNALPRDQQPAAGSKPSRKRGTAQAPPPKEEKKGGFIDRIKGLKGIVTGKKDKKN
jgi:hypothetical protein